MSQHHFITGIAGFNVLSNQSVIARGEASEPEVEVIHRKLEWQL